MSDNPDFIIDRLDQELATLPAANNESRQHLIELGYIPLMKTNALHSIDVVKASDQFLSEALSSGLFPSAEIEQLKQQGKDYLIRQLLRKATDIDEGINIPTLPMEGAVNLITRIIHYRLDIFGLWPHAIATRHTSINTLSQLKVIAGYAQCSPLEAINFLSDMEAFTRRLLSIYEEKDFILTIHSQQVSGDLKKKLDRRFAFKRQLIEDFGDRNDFFIFLRKHILKERENKIDFDFLKKEARNDFKQFIMRLIQIHQWQEGFYDGLLDSNMGELTLKSFLDAIDLYNKANNRWIKPHRIITYVEDGYFLFNALFFLQEYMIEDHAPQQRKEDDLVLSAMADNLAKADEGTQLAFQQNMEQLKKEIRQGAETPPKERKGFLHRVYYGIKRLIKKAAKLAGKLFNWIVDKVKEGWKFLKKLFTHFFEQLSEGLKAFIDGIKFLIGRRAIHTASENNFIISSFSIDGDAVSLVSTGAVQLIPSHLRQVNYWVGAMQFSLAIAGGVLKIIMQALNALSWPILLFTIIKVYKNISKSFKNLQL
ncbi:hypothetical protein DMA11_14395 [Marinilabiliaceae bacterium JC017]|nr:hypothetical protein DMA11_14395 [Marinilabiliaceae bacterium JC017]